MNDTTPPSTTWPDYVNCIAHEDAGALGDVLAERGAEVLEFDGARATDGASLQAELVTQFDLGEAFEATSWDVFRDATFELLRATGPGPVALVWSHADALVSGDLQDLLTAAGMLDAKAIADRRSGDRELTVFLLGDGPGYRRLADVLR